MQQVVRTAAWARALGEIGAVLRLDAGSAESMLDEACGREEARCARCGGRKLYRLSAGKAMSGGRLRCSNCRYSFRLHTGRWLGRHRVPARVWLAAVKCFELGLGHLELAQVAGLSPATADEMIYTIQLSLAAQDPVWRCAAAAALDGGPAPRAFAVKPAGRGVRVEILAGEEPGVRIPVPPGGALPPELRGFLASAKRWMSLSPARFALKLKELEIRSRATEPLFELVLDSLVRYTQTELRAPTPRRSERTAEDLVAA